MPRHKKSPIPHLITDSEYAAYRKLTVRPRMRNNGEHSVEVLYRDPFSGKTRSKSTEANRRDLLALLDNLSAVVSTKRPERLRDPSTPFHVVAQEWFDYAAENGYERTTGETAARVPYSPATLDNKLSFYYAHLLKPLGTKAIGDITTETLALLLDGIKKPHAANKTTRLLRHDIFPYAKKQGYVVVDPAASLEARTAKSKLRKRDYFTVKQVERLLDIRTLEALSKPNVGKGGYWVKEATYYSVHLHGLVELGVRIGELAGISEHDLELSDEKHCSCVNIVRSRLQDYRDRTKVTKTEAGDRTVFISDEFANLLREHLVAYRARFCDATIDAINPNRYVFTTPTGAPINIRAFRRQFRKFCLAAGITNLGSAEAPIAPHPHTMRHTWFTHMAESKVPMKTMMDMGGQTDPRATARYMGTTDEERKEAIKGYRARLKRPS